jgi:hypothetical protein
VRAPEATPAPAPATSGNASTRSKWRDPFNRVACIELIYFS